jgi:hypothetical protein
MSRRVKPLARQPYARREAVRRKVVEPVDVM